MFSSPDEFETPPVPARKPARGLSSFWEGLGAAFDAEALETDYHNLRGKTEHKVFSETRDLVDPMLTPDERRELDSMARYDRNGSKRRARTLELAAKYQQDIENNTGETLFSTTDAIAKEAQRRAQDEYRDAMDTLDSMQGWRGTAEFLGRGGAAMTDVTSLALATVSGGSGSLARIVAREAVMGAIGEAAILPRMYQQSEYLDIEDPNPVAQVALGAAFSGAFAGGAKALTKAGRAQISNEFVRAMEYAKTRNRSVPSDADVGVDDAIVEIDQAEDALARGEPVTPRANPPLLMRDEDLDAAPKQGDELPDLGELQAEVEAAESAANVSGKSEKVLARHFGVTRRKTSGGWKTERNIQIHPDGDAAKELGNMGITTQTRPGLFSREHGLRSFDNMPADEWEDMVPGITNVAGLSDDGIYLDRDGFVQALGDDLLGNGPSFLAMERVRAARDALAQGESAHDAPEEWVASQRAFKDSDGPVEEGDLFVDVTELENRALFAERYDPYGELESDFDAWAERRGYAELLTDAERQELISLLSSNGGSAEEALVVMWERQLWADKASRRSRTETPDGNARAQEEPSQPDAGSAERPGNKPGGAGGDSAAPENAGSPVFESTDAGSQSLIPGVAPVSERQRLEASQNAAMRGGDAAPDEAGLFGDPAARVDLFDDGPASEGAELANTSAEVELRDAIEAGGDFDVTFQGKSQPASKWLDEMQDDLDFVETAELCGIKRADP